MEANTKEIQSAITPKEIAAAINAWTCIRQNATVTIDYLNLGNCFTVTKEAYWKWRGVNPKYIHAYPAIIGAKLVFILIDSFNDSQDAINYDFVYTFDFAYGTHLPYQGEILSNSGNPEEFTTKTALERVFRWQMNKNKWVNEKVNTLNGIFHAFRIPFTDFTELFTEGIEKVYVNIGLTSEGMADLILWNEVYDFSVAGITRDVTMPVPPFVNETIADYQLLLQSTQ